MRRIGLIVTLALGILSAPLATGAQQPPKVQTIGILGRSATIGQQFYRGTFLKALREFGYVEGQNVAIEYRWAEEHDERFPDLAAELIRLKVDVILAGAGPASLNAARNATKTIPIVMVASSSDPVGEGLAASLARPGGNITGIVTGPEELSGKRLQLLKEAVPGLSRVGVLWDATIGPFRQHFLWRAADEAARSLGIELLPFEVRDPKDFDEAVRAATKERVGALIVVGTPMFTRHRGRIADLLGKHGLPAISQWRQFAEAGLLMTYGPSLPDQFRRAAVYVGKILKGAKAADLPIEQPTKFEFVINLKTAKALGLTIPQSVLIRADEVIQ